MATKIVRPEWSFPEALAACWQAYVGSGIESSGRRLTLLRQWAEMVGRDRALSELDAYVAEHKDTGAAARTIGVQPSTLKRLRGDFKKASTIPMVAAPAPKLAEGEQIKSTLATYTIGRQVGRGGMGRVYRAKRDDGREVAAKLLSSDRFDIGPKERARFLREAEIARGLDHPNVVRALDVIQHRGQLVSIMEFIEGDTLHDRLGDHGRPERDTAVRWMKDLARGVAYLHENRIVHRDISTKNALFRRDGTLALADFGIARRLDDPTLTTDADRLGSLIFISPQQRETPHDAQSTDDVYSLGQVFFAIITGKNPHGSGPLAHHENGHDDSVRSLVEAMRGHDRELRPSGGTAVFLRLDDYVRRRDAGLNPSPETMAVVAGPGPMIYVNDERTPGILGITLHVVNPFDGPIVINDLRLKIFAGGRGIYSTAGLPLRERILPRRTHVVGLAEIELSDAAARIVKSSTSDWTELNLQARLFCKGDTGEFQKDVDLRTIGVVVRDGERVRLGLAPRSPRAPSGRVATRRGSAKATSPRQPAPRRDRKK